MFRFILGALLLFGLGLIHDSAWATTPTLNESDAMQQEEPSHDAQDVSSADDSVERPDEITIRQAIASFDTLTEEEKQQRLVWFFNAINSVPDAQIRGQLSEALETKLAQWTPQEAPPLEEPLAAAKERENFEALLKEQQKPLPSEEEIRRAIDALTLDLQHPEVGLTKAVGIGDIIDRIDDAELQLTLRRLLEDRVSALQAN